MCISVGVGSVVVEAKLSACELGFILEHKNLGYACNRSNLEEYTFLRLESPWNYYPLK